MRSGRVAANSSAGNFHEEGATVAVIKKKGKHHEQESIKPGKSRKDELSEKDLDKASGGGTLKYTE